MARKVNATGVVTTPADSIREGCPVRIKQRHFILPRGRCAVVQWELRHADGVASDISDCMTDHSASVDSTSDTDDDEFQLKVRFQNLDDGVLGESTVDVIDASEGLVEFIIPAEVAAVAGVYRFQIALMQAGIIVFTDGGLISIESGMWGDLSQTGGPPTIEEIRFHLRDRAKENSLLMEVEFDDADIIAAIVQPIRQFNETPPPLASFSCANFPYRFHWRNAIVGELLRSAAHGYLRNKTQIVSGGLQADDKNKNREYLELSLLYAQEWKEFIVSKKVQLNASLCITSL